MVNTVVNQPTEASLQLTDYFLTWQGAQSPSTRKTALSALNAYYLALTGGTITGDTTFSAAKPKITGNAGTVRAIQLLTGSTVRWQLDANATAESGTNAGSDLEVWSYTDAGAQLTKALSIQRSSGAVTIVGTNTNDSASSGQVGEFISSSIPSGSAVVLATNVTRNVTSISLTAGDWDVWGSVGFLPVGSATMTILHAAISLTSAGFDADPAGGGHVELSVAFNADNAQLLPAGMRRISVGITTTVYLVANQAFSGSLTAYGFIGARRRR